MNNQRKHDQMVQEFDEFLTKMDWEGGLDGYMHWGGVSGFPERIRQEAAAYAAAEDDLRHAIEREARRLKIDAEWYFGESFADA